MSESLLHKAATIRDETNPLANTARRVGIILEEMINEHDELAKRFPISRIPALVVDISLLNTMNTMEFARVDASGIGSHYIVTRLQNNHIPVSVGTLDVFSDSAHHVITQIFKTHELLNESGQFYSTHDHNHIYVYTRSFGLTMGSQTYGATYFPAHGWGRWRPMTAIPPQEGDPVGMAGLMSAEDKNKLDTLKLINVVGTTGTSVEDVMSQASVSQYIRLLQMKIDSLQRQVNDLISGGGVTPQPSVKNGLKLSNGKFLKLCNGKALKLQPALPAENNV